MSLQFQTQTFTRFTDPTASSGSEKNLVYSAEKWVRVVATLQTAGPVIMGTGSNLSPNTPGQGILLTQNTPVAIVLPRGNRLYMVSNAVDRVAIVIENIPWLEEIAAMLCRLTGGK